jgi:hypothetical protein
MSMLDVDEEEIARQLTLVDFAIFSSIKVFRRLVAPLLSNTLQPTEFLNQAWNMPKLKQRSPNIICALQHFSYISVWVSNTILKTERVKERARIMAKFIRVVEVLLPPFYTILLIGSYST